MLVFEQLKNYSDLNPQDREIDSLCFNSAREYVCRFCGFTYDDELPSELT